MCYISNIYSQLSVNKSRTLFLFRNDKNGLKLQIGRLSEGIVRLNGLSELL